MRCPTGARNRVLDAGPRSRYGDVWAHNLTPARISVASAALRCKIFPQSLRPDGRAPSSAATESTYNTGPTLMKLLQAASLGLRMITLSVPVPQLSSSCTARRPVAMRRDRVTSTALPSADKPTFLQGIHTVTVYAVFVFVVGQLPFMGSRHLCVLCVITLLMPQLLRCAYNTAHSLHP